MNKRQINLIPHSVKLDRRKQNVKKSIYLLSLVPIGLYGYMQLSISNIQKDIGDIQSQISDAEYLELEVKQKETELLNDEQILNKLSKNSFPLHRFLLFAASDIPQDMRLFEVISDNYEIQKTINEKETNQPNQDAQEDESQTDNTTDGEENQEETNNQDFPEQNLLYIRGAAISVNSIGLFIQAVEKYDFIRSVELYDIQNYYNGKQSYKFFELLVEIQ